MLENAKPITKEQIDRWNEEIENSETKVLMHAASKTPISSIVFCGDAKVGNYPNFSIEIKTMKATEQKNSGRCWIFAATNVLREIVAKKINVENFELSQNYVAFYDKLEKINYALESVMDLINVDYDDRRLAHILSYGVGDGGQWDMIQALIKKYGVVPKNVMDETYASSHTADSAFIIDTTIRKFASVARRLHKAGQDEEVLTLKEAYLERLYRMLVIAFGKPVQKFDFEYTDKNGEYHIDKGLTPKSFYDKYIGIDIDDYVSIINSPTDDKPFYKTYSVDYIGNVVGRNIHYLNLPMEELKALVIKQMKNGEVVWFGSDCGKYRDREAGMWDPLQYDYLTAFKIDLMMGKGDMLDYHQSAMNHAMVLTGVNLEDNRPTKWKIENSWGTEIANAGYFTATAEWFDYFVYQAVINKKYLSDEQKKMLEQEPIHLNPWDPMGTLA